MTPAHNTLIQLLARQAVQAHLQQQRQAQSQSAPERTNPVIQQAATPA